MITPKELKSKLILDIKTDNFVKKSIKDIENILLGKDDRFLVIVGPCSIHNIKEGLEYAENLKKLSLKYPNLYIVLRAYFEKPRTTIGWKGLIQDPDLDNSNNIEKGLFLAREFLLKVNKLKLPCATELLEPLQVKYYDDLISYGAIGARTTESQVHREMSSGKDYPIGFKNGTDGNIESACAGVLSSNNKHSFLSINENGFVDIENTKGNKFSHIILRGGKSGPNYDKESIKIALDLIEKYNILPAIIVDASHANSGKKAKKQFEVIKNIVEQKNKNIKGIMIESNINFGKQSFTPGIDKKENLKYGISITDECISLQQTDEILDFLNTNS